LADRGQQGGGQAIGRLVDPQPTHEGEGFHTAAGCGVQTSDEGEIGDVIVEASAGLDHSLLPLRLNGTLELEEVVARLVRGVAL